MCLTAAAMYAGSNEDGAAWSNSLMDVTLGLLAKGAGALPFAPLKEACEALFRHSAELLTSEGVADCTSLTPQSQPRS